MLVSVSSWWASTFHPFSTLFSSLHRMAYFTLESKFPKKGWKRIKTTCPPRAHRDEHFEVLQAHSPKTTRKCPRGKVLSLWGLQSRAMTSIFWKFQEFFGFSRITFCALFNEPIKKGGQDFTQKSLLKIVDILVVFSPQTRKKIERFWILRLWAPNSPLVTKKGLRRAQTVDEHKWKLLNYIKLAQVYQ